MSHSIAIPESDDKTTDEVVHTGKIQLERLEPETFEIVLGPILEVHGAADLDCCDVNDCDFGTATGDGFMG